MDKKFFVFLLMGMFLISFAAASVDFSEEEDLYVIDTIWPTWLGGDGQSVVKMIANTDQCLIDCSFTLEFNNEEPVNLLQEIAFLDNSGNDVSDNIETIKFKIGRYEDVEKSRPVYEEVCEEIQLNETNGTQTSCHDEEVDQEIYYENELVWNDYDGEKVEGLSYLKADAKKKANRRADWVITFRGEDLVRWDWWDNDWSAKREIIITEESGSTLTDYPVRLNITYDAEMQSDFDDLRFLNSAEDIELGYWIERKVDGGWAEVWVEVPSMTASANTSIYMYYGNSGASSNSDIFDPFVFAEDFEADATGWGSLGGSGQSRTSTGKIFGSHEAFINSSAGGGYAWWSSSIGTTMTGDVEFCGWSNYVTEDQGQDGGFHLLNGGNDGYGIDSRTSDAAALRFRRWDNLAPDGDIINTNAAVSYDLNYKLCFRKIGTAVNVTIYNASYNVVRTEAAADTGGEFTSFTKIAIKVASYSEALRDVYFDNIYLYEPASTYPTYEVGEPTNPYGSISVDFVTPPTPVNYANITAGEITIEVDPTYENASLSNITYDFYNVNGTVLSEIFTNETYEINITLPDAHFHYNVTICGVEDIGSTVVCGVTPTQHLNHDTTAPTITPPTNLTDLITLSLPTNSTWSFNASDQHLDSCYYNTSEQNTTVVTCNSTIQTAWATQGNKTITSCANDTFGFETCQTDYIWVYYLAETQADNLDPVGEGTEVEFSLLVNLTNIPSTTAYLVLNNTNFAATTSLAGTNAYYFEADVVIPDGWGNSTGNVIDWNWVYNVSGIVTDQATSTDNITVYALAVDDCSSYGDVILNLSLKDEETDGLLFPPSANSTDVQVDVQIIATDNTSLSWDYSNTWNDDADGIVQICVPSGVLTNSEYKIEFVMGYSAEDYVQEFYYLDNGVLDASKQYNSLTTDQISLYNLVLDDSTTFLFKFFDEDNIEVKDGVVHTFRKYIGDGEFREVERSKSDNNGETHVHLVEEDVIYYFKISLESEILFTSASYSAKCLSTPCQIDLEASGEFEEFDNNWDLANGSYDVTSDAGTRQVSMLYLLEDPKTMNITIMKYSNNPDTMEVVGSDQAYSTGGILSVTVPQVAGNISFIAVVYEDGEVIDTEWVDFSPSGTDYFGATGIFMALLLIICLILMGSSEGEGTLIFAIIGLILISSLKLIDLDYYALIGFICAAAILVWKIAERRKR